jgi:hypothetical protein
MRIMRNLLVTLFILAPAAIASADETIDNPEFANWSKFKPGTSVTIKTVTEFNGMSTESTAKTTLLEVGSDKIVIETAISMTVNGMKIDVPAMKRDVTKTITLTDEYKKAKAEAEKQQAQVKTEEGTETLTIGGVECKCKWRRSKISTMGSDVESKIWMCDDVPGVTVKMESSTSGATPVKTKYEVTEFKKG